MNWRCLVYSAFLAGVLVGAGLVGGPRLWVRHTDSAYDFRLAPTRVVFPPLAPGPQDYLWTPDRKRQPSDWMEREFNGQPYYLIPLGDRVADNPT